MKKKAFQILLEDDFFVAINKPTGILVHRTPISEDQVFVLQLLRNQLGRRIYPIHRLDRATSGVLIFGKTKQATSQLGELFQAQKVSKKYLGVVRGYVADEDRINYPLAKEKWLPKQEAITLYKKLAQTELPFPISRYPTARYSMVEVTLETGRRHQIRRHFAHLRHPIIGDKRHGDVKHNKYWAKELNMTRMLLHARYLSFIHPITQKEILIEASIDEAFQEALDILGFAIK